MPITLPVTQPISIPVTARIGDGPASGGFSPLSLFEGGEAGAWYDMSLASLYQDSALTTPVTATSDPVGGVVDQSPNGSNATQATASKRFQYLTDAQGRPFIRSDADDDVLQTAVASTVVNHGGCVLVSVAAKWVTLPTDCQMGVNTSALGNTINDLWQIGVRGATQSPRLIADNRTPTNILGNLPAAVATEVYTYQWDHDNGSSRLRAWRNGGANGSYDSGSVATNWPDSFVQGNPFLIGARSTADNFVGADWYDIVIRICDHAVTPEERAQLWTYQGAKIGVTL